MKKKFWLILLALVSALCLIFAISACGGGQGGTIIPDDENAPPTKASEGLKYQLNDDKEGYTVTDIGDCTDTNLVIPTEHEGLPVTSIGRSAFEGCSGLESVTIGSGVTSIGSSAFKDCDGLESVTLGSGVISIGEWAFEFCIGLTSVTIPNSVTTIGEWAFAYCIGLTNVTIPNSVTTIGEEAFYVCDGLQSVTIGLGVTEIGYEAFCYTAYYNDDSNWENGTVLYIGNYLIEAKSSISGDYSIRDNTKVIADYSFYKCSGLTSITIPDSVTSIGENAFFFCGGLKAVHITDIAAWCMIDFGGIDANPLYYAEHLYLDGTEIKNLTIPSEITEIKKYAFRGCSGLTSITIPDSVTSIGENAFSYCSGLTSITIGSGVTSIGEWAFYGCSELKTVYYKGTAEEWRNISIDNTSSHNFYLLNATRYYFTEDAPTVEEWASYNSWWHYDEETGEVVEWVKPEE